MSSKIGSTGSGGGRIAWADTARGVCVALVVLHHVTRLIVASGPDRWQTAGSFWLALDELITPVRIPLFFFISGVLASSALSRPLGASRSRILGPMYLYILWSLMLSSRLIVPSARADPHANPALLIAGDVLLAGSGYWYLYALPLYFLACRLTVKVPMLPLFAIAITLSFARDEITQFSRIAFAGLSDGQSLFGSILGYFSFFLLGARCSGLTRRLNDGRLPRLIGVFGALFAILSTAAFVLHGANQLLIATTVETLAALASIPLGVGLARAVPSSSLLNKMATYIGRRTLPVYCGHFFAISATSFLWSWFGVPFGAYSVAGFVFPLAFVVAVLAVTLAALVVSQRVGLGWLFRPPRFLVRPAV